MSRVPLPSILNPQLAPVVACDDHLPPIAADRLTAEALRTRFSSAESWSAVLSGDGRFFGERPAAAASVLVLLVQRPDGMRVLLTRRTAHLREHAGQISFPGGRAERHDSNAAATALRETEEEVGLPHARVEVIGQLPTYTTVTHFVVTPVVALVSPPLELKLDAFEVAEAFEVPLDFLMTPAHHHRHVMQIQGIERQFLSMPWGDYFIWGATAAMLRNLYHFLSV